MSTYQVDTNGGSYQVETDDTPMAPDISKLESFSRGAANNFPLAPQGIAAVEPGDYSKNLSDWNEKAREAKTANPKTYGAGAVSGAVAPLFIPGVGEAIEAAPIAGNAALGAASAISNTDLTKNPLDTLKQAGEGAVVGGATAGALGKVFPSAQSFENMATKKAVQAADMPAGIVGAMTPEERTELGQFIQQNNLVGKDKAQVLEHARDLSKNFGEKIREIGDTANSEALHINPDDHYKAIQDLLDKGQKFEGLKNRDAKGLARDYKAGANDILNLPDNPKWDDIQKLKEQYGKLAFDSKGETKSEGAKDTYFALKDMLKSIAEKAQSNTKLADEYKEALAGYSRMQPIESGLEKAADSELRGAGGGPGARGLAGLIRKLPGPVRAIAGPAAIAMGHPVLGLAAAIPEMMDPAIQSKASSLAAKAAPRTEQGISQAVIDYLVSQRKKNQ